VLMHRVVVAADGEAIHTGAVRRTMRPMRVRSAGGAAVRDQGGGASAEIYGRRGDGEQDGTRDWALWLTNEGVNQST
jgi:hypothetical protein